MSSWLSGHSSTSFSFDFIFFFADCVPFRMFNVCERFSMTGQHSNERVYSTGTDHRVRYANCSRVQDTASTIFHWKKFAGMQSANADDANCHHLLWNEKQKKKMKEQIEPNNNNMRTFHLKLFLLNWTHQSLRLLFAAYYCRRSTMPEFAIARRLARLSCPSCFIVVSLGDGTTRVNTITFRMQLPCAVCAWDWTQFSCVIPHIRECERCLRVNAIRYGNSYIVISLSLVVWITISISARNEWMDWIVKTTDWFGFGLVGEFVMKEECERENPSRFTRFFAASSSSSSFYIFSHSSRWRIAEDNNNNYLLVQMNEMCDDGDARWNAIYFVTTFLVRVCRRWEFVFAVFTTASSECVSVSLACVAVD